MVNQKHACADETSGEVKTAGSDTTYGGNPMSDGTQHIAVWRRIDGSETPVVVSLSTFEPTPGYKQQSRDLILAHFGATFRGIGLAEEVIAGLIGRVDIHELLLQLLNPLDIPTGVNSKKEVLLSRQIVEKCVLALRIEGMYVLSAMNVDTSVAIFSTGLPVTQREINLIEAIIRAAGAFPVRQFLYQGMTIVMGAPSRRDRQQFAA